jgi:translation initiation factor RLI1
MKSYSYPDMTRTQTRGNDKFILHIEKGEFTDSEIVVLLGENGTAKTTFVRMLAGLQKSDEQEQFEAEGYDYEASHPPNVDRLDVAGGLTPGLSEPGNKESTGNLTV